MIRGDRDRAINGSMMNAEHQTLPGRDWVGVFLCTQLPSEIPDWIKVKARVTELGYWGQFDGQDEHIQALCEQAIDWSNRLPAYLASLGFEGVEAAEWQAINSASEWYD